MSAMQKIVVAGAASVPGLNSIHDAFLSLDIDAQFVEAPFMKNYLTNYDKQISFTNSIPSNTVVVPLTEYWISYCIQTKSCRISDKALLSSRSKKYFYDLLNNAGINSVRYFDKAEAQKILSSGKSIVVKPEGLNSGLGIEVVAPQNKDLLDEYIRQAIQIKTKNLKLMSIKNNGYMLTEYIAGDEYSADCFCYAGRISIVRVCRKKIVLINNKPCTLVYQVIKPTQLIEQAITSWIKVIFDSDTISFSQFDFIISEPSNCIVPIDFACRIGGGLYELMSQAESNPYADAIRGQCHLYDRGYILTQLNYLPIKKGYIHNEAYNLAPGYQVVFKHKGDYVTSLPSSIGSRIALVIQKNPTEYLPADLAKTLLVDERWIGE